MNQSLTLTGSAGALAAALAAFDNYLPVAQTADTPAPVTPPVVEHSLTAAAGVPLPVFPAPSPVMPEVTAAAPTISGEPQFDTTGLAWDGRIHSAQKGTTKDGKWRKKRDVADDYYNAVEMELRALYGQPAPTVAPVAIQMPAPIAAPTPMPIPVMPLATAQVVEDDEYEDVSEGNVIPIPGRAVAPVPMVSGAVAAAPVTSEPTMHDVLSVIGAKMQTGEITPDYLVALTQEINQQCGLTMNALTDIAAHPNAVAYAWAAFQRDGKR